MLVGNGDPGANREWSLELGRRSPQSVMHGRGSQQSGWTNAPRRCASRSTVDAAHHPGGNPGANSKSISHRCYLFEVAFVWGWTKETIDLALGCLQGGGEALRPHLPRCGSRLLIRLTCGEKQQALVAPLRILIHVIRIHEEGGGASQRERGREGECVCVRESERARGC